MNNSERWNALLKDERVQQTRQVGKQYSRFFLSALTRPFRTMKTVVAAQALYGLITMALVTILSSFYFLSWFIKFDLSPVFGPGFLKPLLLTALGIAVAYGLTYAVIRLEEIHLDPKLLAARFGTLLVPAVALLVLAIFFMICSLSTFSIYLLVLAYLFIFVAINSVVFQYPVNALAGRLDITYTLVIANAVTGFIFYKLIVSVIAGAIGNIFGSF
ncbi:hypothetical protein [Paenibacillus monticola]|uniref:Uncharacterized protein n=1 Tax=Paenibacillus monticola TaxID=2666075 RepID=A0A7X2KZV0_9BACL|nr:hypothetical protein [Paenibacillus monticola]MRN51458.1 hypothetical protein [Paenibacillus monticola]